MLQQASCCSCELPGNRLVRETRPAFCKPIITRQPARRPARAGETQANQIGDRVELRCSCCSEEAHRNSMALAPDPALEVFCAVHGSAWDALFLAFAASCTQGRHGMLITACMAQLGTQPHCDSGLLTARVETGAADKTTPHACSDLMYPRGSACAVCKYNASNSHWWNEELVWQSSFHPAPRTRLF